MLSFCSRKRTLQWCPDPSDLEKLIEKLKAKFPATTPGCSMLKIARLNDAFLEVFNRKKAQ